MERKKKVTIMKRGDSGDDDISSILGEDILSEILSRLSLKSLMQCMCVRKQWRSLIQSPHFVDLHHARSKPRQSLIICTQSAEGHKFNFYSVKNLFEGGAVVHVLTFMLSSQEVEERSEDGLFCVGKRIDGGEVRIYNPRTGEITPSIKTGLQLKEEPGAGVMFAFYGLGFDPATKKHKVICVWNIYRLIGEWEIVCEVMSLGDNTWRRIDDVPPYSPEGSPVNVNGSLYWIIWNPVHKSLLAFDIGCEKFRVIPIPDFIILTLPREFPNIVRLLAVDGHIAILGRIDNHTVKLWIFEDDNKVKSSTTNSNWTEESITLPFEWNGNPYLVFHPIAGTDEIIMKSSQESHDEQSRDFVSLYYYDRRKKTSWMVEITGIYRMPKFPLYYHFNTFFESLLPVRKQRRDESRNPAPPET